MALSPDAADAAFEAILEAVDRGDAAAARQLATEALAEGLEEPLILLLAADALGLAGRGAEVLPLLRKAVALAPDEAEPARRLGRLLAGMGEDAEAAAVLTQACALAPEDATLLVDAAAAQFRLGALTQAETLFRQAAARAPGLAEPLAGLAAIAARRGQAVAARHHATAALRLCPALPSALLALARAELLEGGADAAVEGCSALLSGDGADGASRIAALDLRAEAWDALDRPAEAFADYAARNALLRQAAAPRFAAAGVERPVARARHMAGWLAVANPAGRWGAAAGGGREAPARGHAFVLGFPRSGTTLLERALGSHPGVVALEEVDHLGTIAGPWLTDQAGLQALAMLSGEAAEAARRAYWQRVQETLGPVGDKVVVDKLPLHTLALPAIARLFPEARILFAIRDPRDVVLSCFRRRFRLNAAMFEFLDLRDAAAFYDAVMALAVTCRATLPLRVMDIRHEEVATAFEPVLRRALGVLGLDWDPAVLGFAQRGAADPRTPSDPQLARGLNASGVGQWRRYARELGPVLEQLAPWVARFGYPP